MRQEMPEKGRISGASQVYLLSRERDTCFQHDSREDGHENDTGKGHLAVWRGVVFGAAHLPTVMALYRVTSLAGIPPLVLVEVFLLNGVLGLIAGVWYRRDGLIAASGIHFWADIVWHVIWPLLLGAPYLLK